MEVYASIPPEGYELSITTNGVTIRHSDDAGLFYAKVTLEQLKDATKRVPPGEGQASSGPIALPCLKIKDSPAFKWRGVHLGETQRLFGKVAIKRMPNQMSRYTFTPRDLEWKMWPRALATAEIIWTNPDPAKRAFAEFSARAAEHRRRLVREHFNCAPIK